MRSDDADWARLPPLLCTGFLPAFEKFGKRVMVLLGTDEVHFVQTSMETDGPHVMSRFVTVSSQPVQGPRSSLLIAVSQAPFTATAHNQRGPTH